MDTQEPPDIALSATSFRRGNVAEDPAADLASRLFVLDVQERLPGVRRLRDWTLEALAPRAGELAVDVGCGTGAEVRRLAALVGPEGRAVGVEPDEGMRQEADRRAAEEGIDAVFVDGSAEELPFEDGLVDVLRCERVFQHLADPDGAAREFARVLAPGGRAAVVDSDWGTVVQSAGDPDVVRRLNESWFRRIANPFAGRWLRGQLHRAGLVVDPDIAASAVVFPDEVLRAMQFLRMNLDFALEDGSVTPEEAADLERDVLQALDRGEAFFAVTMFGVLGRKPAETP